MHEKISRSSGSWFVRCLSAAFLLALAFPGASLAAEPGTYGTSAVSYVHVPAVAFFPVLTSMAYGTEAFYYQRYGTGPTVFTAPLQLPSGAKLTSLRFDFDDADPSGPLTAYLIVCPPTFDPCFEHPSAGAGPTDCLSPGRICSGDAFAGGRSSESADLTPDDITVDNLDNQYFLRIDTTAAGEQQLVGMVVGYVLQVSPAPATATFNDVPTDHQFFQYIEALSESGITGGCGNGNFCPDAPLTRGQMAVFLAKALGLQWP